MPTSKSNKAPEYTSVIDFPGLQGYHGLAGLVYCDDGKTILRPGFEFDKQTEYMLNIYFAMAGHFVNRSTEDLEIGASSNDCVSMNYLAARQVRSSFLTPLSTSLT